MDPYSSGENSTIKTRKPYTITKQRERWTEEEHNSFLEALKLYGRAWQRIEEHIGTKTAVQIRSHAQKFFSKLEKEALAKGVPVRQALDIEIPPPRPKRKPSNPYPKKTGLKLHPQVATKDVKQAIVVSSLHSGKHRLDLEKQPLPEKTGDDGKLENTKTNEELDQEAPCVSMSSGKAVNPCRFREFIPPLEKVLNHDETKESYITVENKEHQKLAKDGVKHTNTTSNTLIFGSSHSLHENVVQAQHTNELNQPGKCGALSVNDTQGAQNYPRHVPVHILDGNQGMNDNKGAPSETPFEESTLNKLGEVHEHPNLFVNIAASATPGHHNNALRSSCSQTVPSFHPLFIPACDNQEDCRSLFHISSTISSLIVSSLLQNPAAHAAASLAATFWHSANMEASSEDSSARGDYSSNQSLNSVTPSMTAIAAATVAAATAWWASHGLLPVCAPFHSGYPSAFAAPMDSNQARLANNGREKSPPGGVFQEEKADAEQSEALFKKHPPSKSTAQSSSDGSDRSGDRKLNTGLTAAHTNEAVPVDELHDSSKIKVRKQIDRSSCGSNSTSSCEIETDALEKQGKDKEETKESDVNLPCNDSIFRRSRSSISPSESWKEVSEEGRLAFQALFSREVLPQSFSPPHGLNNQTGKDQQNVIKNSVSASQLDLNNRSWVTCSTQHPGETNTFALLRGEKHGAEGLLTMGLGNVKLKVHHTGFKPYKRCSVEAKESKIVSTVCQNDEKCSKRMRLEGEAST